jgi:putative flavoprotein involved in K+ transport
MGRHQRPRVPPFASQLDPAIVQLHSFDYRSSAQLKRGDVLIVGVGNSGAEIARELVATHPTWLAGKETGEVPFRVNGLPARLGLTRLLLRVAFHRVLTVDTPFGRKVRARVGHSAAPLIRVKSKDLVAAGVQRVPRVVGVKDGRPRLEDGRVLDVANVVWCTGFDAAFSWIDLPIFNANGDPQYEKGVVAQEPGLFFVGQPFLYAFSSEMIHGVGRDAARIATVIAATAARVPKVEPTRTMNTLAPDGRLVAR